MFATATQKALRKLKTTESALARSTDLQILLNNLSEEILSFGKKYAEDNWYWFPKTYPYSGNAKAEMRRFAVKMKTKEHLSRVSKVFGYTSINQFISKFKEVENSYREGKYRLYRLYSCFNGAPILYDFITSDELGISN